MKASIKRNFSILISALMFIGSFCVYVYLVKPIYFDIKKLKAETTFRLDVIAKHESYIQKIQSALKQYQNVADISEAISLILPTKLNIINGLNQIIGLSNLYNLKIDSLSIEKLAITPSNNPTLVKGLGVLRIHFKIIGNYENFKSFLRSVETNINLMDLNSLKTNLAEDGSLHYTMSIDTYYQAQ